MVSKKKTFKLKGQQQDFSLIAISCAESLHKLSWLLNSSLLLNLTQDESLSMVAAEKMVVDFPVHKCFLEETDIHFALVKNRVDGFALMKSHLNIDYLLKIAGDEHALHLARCVKAIKSIPGVIAVIPIEVEKNKEFSVFESF